jgi:chromosome segregation ATPase
MTKTDTKQGEKQRAESPASTIEEIDKRRRELGQAIHALSTEISDVAAGIAKSEHDKTEAKERYTQALDLGDEQTMKAALGDIRQANSCREQIVLSLRQFEGRITALEAAREGLTGQARLLVQDATAVAQKAQNDLKDSERNYNAVVGLAHSLIAVKAKTGDALRSATPAQTEPTKPTDEVRCEGNL